MVADVPTYEGFDRDWRIRLTAITEISAIARELGGVVRRRHLDEGFAFEGERIRYWNPRKGIWKPRQCDSGAALSVFTAPPRPGRRPRYDDEIGRDGSFAYRYEGTTPEAAANRAVRVAYRESRPLIYIYGIGPDEYFPICHCFVEHDDPDELTFTLSAQPASLVTVSGIGSRELEVTRRYETVEVKKRIHQRRFSHLVVTAYRTQCAMCRLGHKELLDAAHILEDRDVRGRAEVPNGLCLCKIHHAAYDADILGVDPDRVIHVRRDILEEIDGPMLRYGLQGLEASRISVPRSAERRPNPDYLAERFERFRAA